MLYTTMQTQVKIIMRFVV